MEASRTQQQIGSDGDTRQETAYVILQLIGGEPQDRWIVVAGGGDATFDAFAAGSGDAAIKSYLETVDEEVTGETFVAVPVRSWRPRPVGGVEEVPAKRQFKLG